jgi:nicotinate-nucleotide adenylyltransferase
MRMVELALAEPIELERSGPSYTIETLELLQQRHPEQAFALIVGLDAFRELHTWHRHEDIPARCDLVVTSRPPDVVDPGPGALERATDAIAVRQAFWYESRIGCFRHRSGHRLDFVPVTALDISASAVRAAVAAGRSNRFLTPDAVIAHIASRGLYRARSA